MNSNRALSLDEIQQLERQGCTADSWNSVTVGDNFSPLNITEVHFSGQVRLGSYDETTDVGDGLRRQAGIHRSTLCNVTVGNNTLIEGVGQYIANTDIGDDCYISHVGRMVTTGETTFGQLDRIAVLNEGGDGNVVKYPGLTAQMAAFMVRYAGDEAVMDQLSAAISRRVRLRMPARTTIGKGCKVIGTAIVQNAWLADGCYVDSATRISDSTLAADSYVGNDVIIESSIVAGSASVVDGAKVYNCFVGEACHIGKGASAEASIFFANSYLDNGEACAAFWGPFTVSHHKSTLLIGGQYSFYNAGSGTNFSNHAYKVGPIHWGVMQRGAKTASGSHILWPATIGAFTMCMGKISNHPTTADLPFSYLFGQPDGTTAIVPGRNLATVGTYRDVNKWPKRDKRPQDCRQSLVSCEWLSPLTVGACIRGERLLAHWQAGQPVGGCTLNERAAIRGRECYDMAIRMFMGAMTERHGAEAPAVPYPGDEWADLAGLLVPEKQVKRLAEELRQGEVDVEARFRELAADYEAYAWSWAYNQILDYYDMERLTEADAARIAEDGSEARSQWLTAIRLDAEKEYQMGDMELDELNNFLNKLQ